MEHTTFAKKTVVLAALGALSLMAATVRAEDETENQPTPVNIAVDIGVEGDKGIASTINNAEASVTWDDKWLKKDGVLGENQVFGGLTVTGKENADVITVSGDGSLTIAFGKDANQSDNADVTFDGVKLTVEKGGTFKNSSDLKFSGGSFTVSVESAVAVEKFENTGTIYLDGSSMTVGSGNVLSTSSDEELTLNVGDVTIGSGATLTNKDKGYQGGNGSEEQADGEEETTPIQTLVQFGTVTVDGGQFKDEAEARSNGERLVIKSVGTDKAVQIEGTSVWNDLVIEKVASVDGKLTDYVEIQGKGDFDVTETLTIGKFAENGAFTINGSTDAEVFADGIVVSAGSHIASNALEQSTAGAGLSWKDGKPAVGTLK